MNKTWSDSEVQFLKDNVHIFNDAKMTEELSILFEKKFSIAAVRKKRQRLNLVKEAHRGFFKVKSKD